MTQTDPTSLGDLWTLIQRDSHTTREAVKRELDDVKKRLDTFVTKDHFEAEKRLLEARIQHAEEALEKLEREAEEREREAREATQGRTQTRREFVYKGVIPVLALIIAAVSLATAFK
jgi:phage-related minor tail protein